MSESDEIYQKRDILMAKMDSNIEHLVDWTKNHTIDDKEFQKSTNIALDELKSFKWKQVGAIAAGLFVVDIIIKIVTH